MKNKLMLCIQSLSVLFLMLFMACGNDNPTNSNSTIFGDYIVENMTVSGQGISITIGPPELVGTLSLQNNGRYTFSFVATSEGVAESGSGTFQMSGNTVNFDDGTMASYNGRDVVTISFLDEGIVFSVVYKKI